MSVSAKNQVKLVEALATWQNWPLEFSTPPKVIQYLHSGATNQSVIIRFTDTHLNAQSEHKKNFNPNTLFRIRLNNPWSKTLGIDRQSEHIIVKALEEKGITPPIIYEDKNNAFTVFKFIPGRIWTQADLQNQTQVKKLRAVVDSYQLVHLPLTQFDYAEYLNHYLCSIKKIASVKADSLSKQCQPFISKLKSMDYVGCRPVLCHHDLIPDNILETETGLKILDWEYAGLGHPQIDTRYIEEKTFNALRFSRNTLMEGDIVDQLIYWLVLLWEELIACLENN